MKTTKIEKLKLSEIERSYEDGQYIYVQSTPELIAKAKKLKHYDYYDALRSPERYALEFVILFAKKEFKSREYYYLLRMITENNELLKIAKKSVKKWFEKKEKLTISCERDRKFSNLLTSNGFFLYNPRGEYNGYGYTQLPLATDITSVEQYVKWQELMVACFFNLKSEKRKREEEKIKKQQREKAKKRRVELAASPEHQAYIMTKKTEREKVQTLLEQVGLPNDMAAKMLCYYLRDITEADRGWLNIAHEALTYSLSNRGIMADWKNGRIEDMDFYECLCRAISAHHRHTETNYEELLHQGISRESARELMMND